MGKKNMLTAGEMEVMETLWRAGQPMTGNELLDSGKLNGWSSGYIHNVLRSILNKKMIRVSGMKQANTQYARTFEPALTKPEYAARLALSVGIMTEQIPEVIEALTRMYQEQAEP